MATIPRTYLTTSKTGLSSIPLKNGQVIAIWDADEVWYDAPDNGERDGTPVRRRISGVKIIYTVKVIKAPLAYREGPFSLGVDYCDHCILKKDRENVR